MYILFKYTLTDEVLCDIMYILRGSDELSITSDLIRGHTDTIILASLIDGDSYGYKINKGILERTNNVYELKEATLYTAFRRLEDGGFIQSYWGNETTGARRRYYSITQNGRGEFQRLKTEWVSAKKVIDKLILGDE